MRIPSQATLTSTRRRGENPNWLKRRFRRRRFSRPQTKCFLAHEEAVPCPTAIALIPAVKYCVVEPQDIELAAAVLFEVSIRGRWTWLARPWESGGLEKQCSAYEDALRYLTALREDHPNLEWLQGIESEGSCRRLRRQVTSEGR